MSNYGDTLRNERRLELAQRAISSELNEYGEIAFATKTEAGQSFPAAAYAYVPDAKMPSTWKLRLWATPGGGPDAGIVGAAIAALGKGFRGNKVQIPAADLPGVKAKVKAAWLKANTDKTSKDLPPVIASADDLEELSVETSVEVSGLVACGDNGNDLELSVKIDDISATPAPEVLAAVNSLGEAVKVAYSGYDVKIDVDIDVDQKSTEAADSYSNELDVDVDGFSQTPSDLVKMTFDSLITAIKTAYGAKFDLEVDIDIDSQDVAAYDETPVAAPSPAYYSTEETQELGSLPPALKAALVKKLTALLAKETDPAKKASIAAKIKAYS